MKLDIHELMDPALRKPVGGCSLRFPHECQLHEGQIRGDWNEVYQTSGPYRVNKECILERGARMARRDDREYRGVFEEGATQPAGMPRLER